MSNEGEFLTLTRISNTKEHDDRVIFCAVLAYEKPKKNKGK